MTTVQTVEALKEATKVVEVHNATEIHRYAQTHTETRTDICVAADSRFVHCDSHCGCTLAGSHCRCEQGHEGGAHRPETRHTQAATPEVSAGENGAV